eukprot:CAMPEP_0117750712 /NCGR_PEP_ID=MMETSP0947-20121206/10538_1 /TAXON_ID=44440 /ORGANISM="Chattonella subsalsa, Strain CCMP2191" /LENGTH=329 /DNA_ID=CAMNT_0005568945 /DNA_START=62 /DNA_END=1051 /DNA_ORIENTATION=-
MKWLSKSQPIKLWAICVCYAALFHTGFCKDTRKNAKDAYQNRGNVPFFIQDPLDGTCLGPNGFTACDTTSLWIFAGRKEGHSLVSLLEPDESQMCLTKMGGSKESDLRNSKCSSKGAKLWHIEPDKHGYYKVMEDGQKNCVQRTMKPHKNSVHVVQCKSGYTPFQIVETAIHDAGFFLESADGQCFDGTKFRMCDTNDYTLLWGIGVKFSSKGIAERSFFRFFDGSKCLVNGKKGLEVGDCKNAGAAGWGLKDGQLSRDNGKQCVVRQKDNSAGIAKCSLAFEHISLAIPEQSINQREVYMQNQHKAQLQEELLERMRLQQQLEAYYSQ